MTTQTRTAHALIVRTDTSMEFTRVGTDLSSIKRAINVEGYIEALNAGEMPGPEEWHAYADDEGGLNGSEENWNATAILRYLGWRGQTMDGGPVRGDVVFLGCADLGDEDGWGHEGDLPTEVTHKIIELCKAQGVTLDW